MKIEYQSSIKIVGRAPSFTLNDHALTQLIQMLGVDSESASALYSEFSSALAEMMSLRDEADISGKLCISTGEVKRRFSRISGHASQLLRELTELTDVHNLQCWTK